MYENKLFIKDGIIYDNIHGCRKQYKYANAMCLLSVLTFTYRVIIDGWINAPGHGISKIGGINGSDKTYLKCICAW